MAATYVLKNMQIGHGPEWEYIVFDQAWYELGRRVMEPEAAKEEFTALRSVSPWEFYRGAVQRERI